MKKLIIALLAAGAAVACVDKGEDIITSDIPAGYGAIRLAVDANLGLKSRAGGGSTRATSGEEWYLTKQEGVEYDRYADFVDEEGILSIPTGSEMKLHIASTDVREENYFWPLAAAAADGTVEKFHADSTVAVFNDLWKQRYLLMGDYKIELAWGDADYEGPVIATDPTQQAKPYFYGINPALTVEPRVQAEVPMTVVMGNSIVRLEFTRNFESYFENGGEFEITTWTESDDEVATVAEGDSTEGGATGDTTNGEGGESTEGGENVEEEAPVGPQPDSRFKVVFPRKNANPAEGKYEEATPFFIKNGAGRRFEISGWAIKQDPASSIKGDTVKFRNVVDLTTQTVDGQKMQGIDVEAWHADYYPKMYSYKLDVEANYVTVSVQLNAEPSDSKMYVVIPDLDEENDSDSDVEINDDARPDTGEDEENSGTTGDNTTEDGETGNGTTGGDNPENGTTGSGTTGEGTTGEGTTGEGTTNGTTGEGTTNGDETTNGSSSTTPQS